MISQEYQEPGVSFMDQEASGPRRGDDLFISREEARISTPDPDVGDLVKSLRDHVIRRPESTPDSIGPYRELVDAVDDFIFVIDLNGAVERLNRSMAAFLGRTPEEIAGQPFEQLTLLSPSEEAEELLARVIEKEEVVRFEKAVQTPSGTRHFYATLSPMRDAEGGITGILGVAKDVSEIVRARDELRSLSMIDELTGVYNRRGFMSLAGQHLNLASRNMSRLCVVMADLDGLKAINDRFGHHRGDEALVTLASVLRANCRQSDVVGRIAGDEFALLASGISEGDSSAVISRLLRAIDAENMNSDRPYLFSASFGAVECLPDSSCSISRLLEEADRKMYEVKRSPRS